MAYGKQDEERGPIRAFILGTVVNQPEERCYTFLLPRGQKVFFKPDLFCRHVSELPQCKVQGEFEAKGIRVAMVDFPDPKNTTPEADYKFFGWLI